MDENNKKKGIKKAYAIIFIFGLLYFINALKAGFNLESLINIIIFGVVIFSIYKNIKNKKSWIELAIPKQNTKNQIGSASTAINQSNPAKLQTPAEIIGQVIDQIAVQDEKLSQPNSLETSTNAISSQPASFNQLAAIIINSLSAGNNGMRLSKKKKYLQIALNGTLDEAISIVEKLPRSEKIIIEAGTPLIKIHGAQAVKTLRQLLPNSYIVADIKIADLASREVETFKQAGANAATALGVAPLETLTEFISTCKTNNLDSMIDMMNVPSSLFVLKKLPALPDVVILHRGVDETESAKGKMIPYYQINQIKGNYNLIVSVAGGDTPKEIQSAIFNGANIVVVWKDFQTSGGVSILAENFLKEIK